MGLPSGVALSVLLAIGITFPHRSDPALGDSRASLRIAANDNRHSAGTLREGRLELKLEIVNAQWFPEAESGPSVTMQAFAEEGRAPEIPGPMIRLAEGTEITVTLHNSLDVEMVVHGLHTRPATTDDVVKIPAGVTRQVSFQAGAPGTYFYWARMTAAPSQYRSKDSQLSGAIIVEPRNGTPSKDRVFIIGVYRDDPDSLAGRTPHPREIVVANGKSWPYTEQFTFAAGDTASWRVINVSGVPHPMHLHGFYFNLERSGTDLADSALVPTAISQANTRVVLPLSTMAIRFVPDRPGNWLFHCHLALHVDGKGTLLNMINRRPWEMMEREHVTINHGVHEMAGLIIGIHVLPGKTLAEVSNRQPLRLRLLIQNSPRGYSNKPAMGFVLQQGAEPKRDSVTLPGPTLFLKRGRPARITVVNRLKAPTSVHWHGLEIESYPDGVAGWSGMGDKIAPMIEPNDSFIAEFIPPRAGTFIYHSHMNELTQTNAGMYGALIVVDSTHPFNTRIDKIILVGGGGAGNIEVRSPGMVNGTVTPQLELEAGKTYRLHIIQIHPQFVVVFRLGTDSTTAQWTPVAKDGADLPPTQATSRAAFVTMGPGETGEYLYTPEQPGLERLNIQTRLAGWHVPVTIVVRPAKKLATN